MGMVLTDNFADRPSGLLMRAVGEDAAFVHCVEDTTVNGLQAVANVRKGAGGDDRHGVLDEGLLHLAAELADLQGSAVDVFAGGLAAVYRAKALLQLLVIFFLLVRVGVRVVGRGLAIILGAGQQALQIVGQARGLVAANLVVHIVCHVRPPGFSWSFSAQRAHVAQGIAKSSCPRRRGSGRRARASRCRRGGTRPDFPSARGPRDRQ